MRLLMVLRFLLVSVRASERARSSTNRMASKFSSPGDFVIGGMFPVHSSVQYQQNEAHLDLPICTSFHALSYCQLLSMRFAIEEINNSSLLLPNITLGYDIHDTCSDTQVALQPALSFAATQLRNTSGVSEVEVRCNYTDYQPRVVAVIGPASSDICIVLARLFGFFAIPQISYSASSEILSDRARFPSFFRTVPSDKSQVWAIVQLVSHFHWNWIAALGSDDEYGRKGLESFAEIVSATETCLAYQDLLPVHASEEGTSHRLSAIVDGLVLYRVNVTILFTSEIQLAPLIRALISRNVTGKVWIASTDWTTAASIASITNISSLGTVIGFAVKSGHIEGFREYVENILAEQGSQWSDSGAFKPSSSQQCWECDSLTLANVSTLFDSPLYQRTFSTYTAVYAVAHALHELLHCNVNNLSCDKTVAVYPWKLLEQLTKVNFTLGMEPVFFSKTGGSMAGYDLITWDWTDRSRMPHFKMVGQYDTQLNSLQVNGGEIHWPTGDNEAPPSNCSQQCQPGQMKRVKDYNSCCYECESCPAGFFQNISDDPHKCTPCPSHQWSTEKSTVCKDRDLEYPKWEDAASILLSTLAIVGFLLIIVTIIVFIQNRHTPAVHTAGYLPSLLMLLSMACVLCSCHFFIGEPSHLCCGIRQPFFSGSFTVCLSVLLGKALQVSGLCHKGSCIYSHSTMYILILLNISIQAGLCFSWYFCNPPFVVQNPNISASSLVVECQEGSFAGFGLLISHDGLLAVISFMLTFMGRSLSKSYPSARNIAFSMVIYFIAWVFFIPMYATSKRKNIPFFQVGSGLISVLGIIAAYFIPRCYIIMHKPELNTLLYFQSFTQETMHNSEDKKSEVPRQEEREENHGNISVSG